MERPKRKDYTYLDNHDMEYLDVPKWEQATNKFIDQLLESHPQGSKEVMSEELHRKMDELVMQSRIDVKKLVDKKWKEDVPTRMKIDDILYELNIALSKLSNSPKEVKGTVKGLYCPCTIPRLNYGKGESKCCSRCNLPLSPLEPTNTNSKEEVQHNISEEEIEKILHKHQVVRRVVTDNGMESSMSFVRNQNYAEVAKEIKSLLPNHNSGEEKE